LHLSARAADLHRRTDLRREARSFALPAHWATWRRSLRGCTNTRKLGATGALAITGEDAITVDRKFRDAWTGRLPTRFVILTNELPRLTDASGALASRFMVFALTRSFYGREDAALTGKLIVELPGILKWAIEGQGRLTKRGHFVQPPSAKQAVEEMADLGSPMGAFLRNRCEIGQGYAVEVDTLYGAWTAWCSEQHRDHPGTVQMFGRDLRAAVPGLDTTQPRDTKTGDRIRYYQGVRLIPAPIGRRMR
jgi:putative DNA primase/helicase